MHHPNCLAVGLQTRQDTSLIESTEKHFGYTVIPRLTRFVKSRRSPFPPFFIFFSETQTESVPEPDEIGNLIEEVVYLVRLINLEVDSDDVQELLDSRNQELTMVSS
ncbi:hypothetical protein TNCV_5078611 [Trichonephila clavipes]|nr:hypothetical protein TNCV_5078611 [Trichonephila clavipes]